MSVFECMLNLRIPTSYHYTTYSYLYTESQSTADTGLPSPHYHWLKAGVTYWRTGRSTRNEHGRSSYGKIRRL